MVLDAFFRRASETFPIPVMLRALLERVFEPARLNDVGAELRLRFGQRAEHGDRAACIGGQLRRAPVVDAQHHQGGVESHRR